MTRLWSWWTLYVVLLLGTTSILSGLMAFAQDVSTTFVVVSVSLSSAFALLACRAATGGVTAKDGALVVRGLLGTRRLPMDDILSIEAEVVGDKVIMDTWAPVIEVGGASPESVTLSMLTGYTLAGRPPNKRVLRQVLQLRSWSGITGPNGE